MKSSLDHLPERQQDELAAVKRTLLEEFEAALKSGAGGTSPWRKDGRVLKVVLFGSYARSDWVDEPQNGYLSDFDLLVIVSHPKLTDIADYWYVAEDKILRDERIGRTVNLIVHTMDEVNQALLRGEYFWTDIIRDGVALYELPGHPFATPRPMTRADAFEAAQQYFASKFDDVGDWLRLTEMSIAEGVDELRWRRKAAFNLHQATEAAYICFLLVHTFYFPRSHNIKFLRSLAEDADKRLAEAWPRDTREDRRRFEMLKRAYVEARYSDQFEASAEDLAKLQASAQKLRGLVELSCRERLDQLKAGRL